MFDELLKELFILEGWIRFSKYEKINLIDVCDSPYQ